MMREGALSSAIVDETAYKGIKNGRKTAPTALIRDSREAVSRILDGISSEVKESRGIIRNRNTESRDQEELICLLKEDNRVLTVSN